MIAVRNIKKFLDDHPDISVNRHEIMERAKSMSEKSMLSGGAVRQLFNSALTKQFFSEFETDPDHLQIAMDDFEKSRL